MSILQRAPRLASLLTIALLLTPIADAYWAAKGSIEADTQQDWSDGYIWRVPLAPGENQNKVYFNTVKTSLANTNPNLALLRTDVPTFTTSFNALMGIWRDCNFDGYIGDFESVLYEYPSQLLDGNGQKQCPAQVPPNNPAPSSWPVHNDGTWVREFIAIGPWCNLQELQQWGDTCSQHAVEGNPAVIRDDRALVWGDNGKPGESKRIECPIVFLPNGTAQTTGGVLRYGQCQLQSIIPGLGQAGLPTDCRSMPEADVCNYQNPYGAPGDGSAIVYKCAKIAEVRDPLTGQTIFVLAGPDLGSLTTAQANPSGTLYGTTQHTFGTCGGNRPEQYDMYRALETNAAITPKRAATDWDFVFYEGKYRRNLTDAAPTEQQVRNTIFGSNLSTTGSMWALSGALDYMPMWIGTRTDTLWTNPYITKTDLTPPQAQHFTFYARVDPATTSARSLVFPGVTGAYGSEWCGANIGNGQDGNANVYCDPTRWYPHGANPHQVRIGKQYQLRDVDCYDQNLWAVGPDVGPSAIPVFNDNPCQRPDPMLITRVDGVDANEDCMSDKWQVDQAAAANPPLPILEAGADADGDLLPNIDEFAWRTIPVNGGAATSPLSELDLYLPDAHDYDMDWWIDGEEVPYWDQPDYNCKLYSANSGTFLALYDEDSFTDLDGDRLFNQHDADSDGDGLPDGDEVTKHYSYPEFTDSDCAANATSCPLAGSSAHPRYDPTIPKATRGDRINDKQEWEHWVGAGAFTNWGDLGNYQDLDGDGIPSNLLDPDSDGDGILDGDEILYEDTVNANPASPASLRANITRFWTFDTDQDHYLDGGNLTLDVTDSRYFIFADASMCRKQLAGVSIPTRLFVGEKGLGTRPNAPDPASRCAETGGIIGPTEDAFWDAYREVRNYDVPYDRMHPSTRNVLQNNLAGVYGEANTTVVATMEQASGIIANATAATTVLITSDPVTGVATTASELTNQTLHAVNGIVGCATTSANQLQGQLQANPTGVVDNLNSTVTCAMDTVTPYVTWLTERTTETVTGLVGDTLQAAPLLPLVNNTASRTLAALREQNVTDLVNATLDAVGSLTVTAGAADGAVPGSQAVPDPTKAPAGFTLKSNKSRMPTFTYDTVSSLPLGLGAYWPQVSQFNEEAKANSGGLVDPIGTIDGLAYSVYAQSQGPANITTAQVGGAPARLDIDGDGAADLEVTLTASTQVVEAPGTTTGTAFRVTPSIVVRKLDPAKAFNATVITYMQVVNTNYVVGLGFDSLQADAPDTWTATLNGFDTYESTDRTVSVTVAIDDARPATPLHTMLGAFQVNTSQAMKPVIPGRETVLEAEASGDFPNTLTTAVARTRPSHAQTQFTLNAGEASTLKVRLSDKSSKVDASFGFDASVGVGETKFTGLGSAQRMNWKWEPTADTPILSLNYSEVVNGVPRAFDLTATGVAKAPLGDLDGTQFNAVTTSSRYNLTSKAATLAFGQYEGTLECPDLEGRQHEFVVQKTGSTFCARGKLDGGAYVDVAPSATALTTVRTGSSATLGTFGLYVNDTARVSLYATAPGKALAVDHNILPNGTRETRLTADQDVTALDFSMRMTASGKMENVELNSAAMPAAFQSFVDPTLRSVNFQASSGATVGTLNVTNTTTKATLTNGDGLPVILRDAGGFLQASVGIANMTRLHARVESNGSLAVSAGFARPHEAGIWIEARQTKGYTNLKAPAGSIEARAWPRAGQDGLAMQFQSSAGLDKFSSVGTTEALALRAGLATIPASTFIEVAPNARTAAVQTGGATLGLVDLSFAVPAGAVPVLPAGFDGLVLQPGRGALRLTSATGASMTADGTLADVTVSPERPAPFLVALDDASTKRRLTLSARPVHAWFESLPTSLTLSSSATVTGWLNATTGLDSTSMRVEGGLGALRSEWVDDATFKGRLLLTDATATRVSVERFEDRAGSASDRAWNFSIDSPRARSEVTLAGAQGQATFNSTNAAGTGEDTPKVTARRTVGGLGLERLATSAKDYAMVKTEKQALSLSDVRSFTAHPILNQATALLSRVGGSGKSLFLETHAGTTAEFTLDASNLPATVAFRANSTALGGYVMNVNGSAALGSWEAQLASHDVQTNQHLRVIFKASSGLPSGVFLSWEPDAHFVLESVAGFDLELAAGTDGASIPWPSATEDSLVLDAMEKTMSIRMRGVKDLHATQGRVTWGIPIPTAQRLGAKITGPVEVVSFAASPTPATGDLSWSIADRFASLDTGSTLALAGMEAASGDGRLYATFGSVPAGTASVKETSPGRLYLESTGGALGEARFSWTPNATTTLQQFASPGIEVNAKAGERGVRLYLTSIENATIDAGDATHGAAATLRRAANATAASASFKLVTADATSLGSATLGTSTGSLTWPSLDAGATSRRAAFASLSPGGNVALSSLASPRFFELSANRSSGTGEFTTDGTSWFDWTPAGQSDHDVHAAWRLTSSAARVSANSLTGGMGSTLGAGLAQGVVSAPSKAGRLVLAWSPAGTTVPTTAVATDALSIQATDTGSVLMRLSDVTAVNWTARATAPAGVDLVNVTVNRQSSPTTPAVVHVLAGSHNTRALFSEGMATYTQLAVASNLQDAKVFLEGIHRKVNVTHLTTSGEMVNVTLDGTSQSSVVTYRPVLPGVVLDVGAAVTHAKVESNLKGSLLRSSFSSIPGRLAFETTGTQLREGTLTTQNSGTAGHADLRFSPAGTARVAGTNTPRDYVFIESTGQAPYAAASVTNVERLTWGPSVLNPAFTVVHQLGTGGTSRNVLVAYNTPDFNLAGEFVTAPSSWAVAGSPSTYDPSAAPGGPAPRPHGLEVTTASADKATVYEYDATSNKAAWLQATDLVGGVRADVSAATGGTIDVDPTSTTRLALGADDGNTRIELDAAGFTGGRIEASRAACTPTPGQPIQPVLKVTDVAGTSGATVLRIADAKVAPKNPGTSHLLLQCDQSGLHGSLDLPHLSKLAAQETACGGVRVTRVVIPAERRYEYRQSMPSWNATVAVVIDPEGDSPGVLDLTIDCRDSAPFVAYTLQAGNVDSLVDSTLDFLVDGPISPVGAEFAAVNLSRNQDTTMCAANMTLGIGRACVHNMSLMGNGFPAHIDAWLHGKSQKEGFTLTGGAAGNVTLDILAGPAGSNTMPLDPRGEFTVDMDIEQLNFHLRDSPANKERAAFTGNKVTYMVREGATTVEVGLNKVAQGTQAVLTAADDASRLAFAMTYRTTTTLPLDVLLKVENCLTSRLHVDDIPSPLRAEFDIGGGGGGFSCTGGAHPSGPEGLQKESKCTKSAGDFEGTFHLSPLPALDAVSFTYAAKCDGPVLHVSAPETPAATSLDVDVRMGSAGWIKVDAATSEAIDLIDVGVTFPTNANRWIRVRAYDTKPYVMLEWDFDGRDDLPDYEYYVACDTTRNPGPIDSIHGEISASWDGFGALIANAASGPFNVGCQDFLLRFRAAPPQTQSDCSGFNWLEQCYVRSRLNLAVERHGSLCIGGNGPPTDIMPTSLVNLGAFMRKWAIRRAIGCPSG